MGESPLPAIRLCPGHATLAFSAPAGWTWRKQPGDHHNLWLVLEGQGTLHADGRSAPLGPGSACVLPPRMPVEVVHDRRRPIRNFSAHFTIAARGAERFPLLVARQDLFPDLRSLALQALQCADDGALGMAQATHLVSAMLCLLLRGAERPAEGRHAASLRELGQRIRLHPERPWPMAAIAAELGLSRAQAARCFRDAFGMPPARFAIRCRMERARQLLLDTDLAVGAVAGLVGYADLFYFSRHFKAVVGCPPSALRRTAPR